MTLLILLPLLSYVQADPCCPSRCFVLFSAHTADELRRSLVSVAYAPVLCAVKGCSDPLCKFAHNMAESQYHPDVTRAQHIARHNLSTAHSIARLSDTDHLSLLLYSLLCHSLLPLVTGIQDQAVLALRQAQWLSSQYHTHTNGSDAKRIKSSVLSLRMTWVCCPYSLCCQRGNYCSFAHGKHELRHKNRKFADLSCKELNAPIMSLSHTADTRSDPTFAHFRQRARVQMPQAVRRYVGAGVATYGFGDRERRYSAPDRIMKDMMAEEAGSSRRASDDDIDERIKVGDTTHTRSLHTSESVAIWSLTQLDLLCFACAASNDGHTARQGAAIIEWCREE